MNAKQVGLFVAVGLVTWLSIGVARRLDAAAHVERSTWSERHDLVQARRALCLVAPDPMVRGACQGAVERLRERGWQVQVADQPSNEHSQEAALSMALLLSDPAQQALAARYARDCALPGLPTQVLEWPAFLGEQGVLVVQRALPSLPRQTFTLAVGGNAASVAAALEELEPCERDAWAQWDEHGLLRGGALHGGQASLDFQRNEAAVPTRPIHQAWLTAHVGAGLDDAAAQNYLERAFGAAQAVLAFADPETDLEGPIPSLDLFASAEDLLFQGVTGLAHCIPRGNRVRAWIGPQIPGGSRLDDGGFELARCLARARLGPPSSAWLLEGVAADAAGSWWGKPIEEWCSQLAPLATWPSLDELMSEDSSAALLEHVRIPARGLLFRMLRRIYSDKSVRDIWQGAEPGPELAQWWNTWLESTVAAARAGERSAPRSQHLLHAPMRTGVVLQSGSSPAPWQRTSFGSRACEQRFDELAQLGANAVALELFASLEGPAVELPGRPRRLGPFLDPDLAIAASVHGARARGLGVLLRPTIYVADSAGLAGMTPDGFPGGFDECFARLEGALMQLALVGELSGAEILCLAENTPVTTATAGLATGIARGKERWLELIERLRLAFTGLLTYGADPRVERGDVEFWGALDFLGTELLGPPVQPQQPSSQPVPGAQRPSDAALVQFLVDELLSAIFDAEAVGKRGLVTAIGFPAAAQAWRVTAGPLGAPDPAEQARLAHNFAEAARQVRAFGRDLAGVYWYAWHVDPARSGMLDRGWSTRGKPASDELRRLFRQQ